MAKNPEFWASAEALNRYLQTKVCLATNELDACEGSIIRAHTIARSQLSKIARDGHVKAFNSSPAQLEQSGGDIAVKNIGITQFSVLNCFCAKHDLKIFSDIENIPLVFSPRQLALLHYRAAASELYRKTQTHEATLNNLKLFSGKTGAENRAKASLLAAMSEGEQLAIRDMGTAFGEIAGVLQSEEYWSAP